MKKNKVILFLLVTTLFLCSCGTTSTVPITGRKQHLLVSDEQVMSLSNEQYQSYMKTAKPSTNAANTAMVRRVGERLANAFCMPGGKIVVYEGLLPYTQNEASLAVVLGHEIAHAVAKHSAERMSQQMKAQYGAQALSLILGGSSSATQEIAQQVYGLGAQYGVMLPYSRNNESEADYMGLIFAAMAGYDPNVAVSFWQRMSQAGSGTPEFMSDHPSDASRIAAIQKEMPEALKYYKGNNSVRTINFSHKKSNRK